MFKRMKRIRILLGAALLLSLLPCLAGCGQGKKASSSEWTLASYNIRNAKGLDGRVSYDRIAEVIRKFGADAVAIQEADSATQRSHGLFVLQELGRRTGMYPVYAPAIDYNGGTYGIGMLCSEQPVDVKRFPLPGEEERRALLVVEFPRYVYACTHLSLTEKDRLASVAVIVGALKGYQKPVFLAGDWNDTPDSPFLSEMKKSFDILTRPDAHTFPADAPENTIDYIALLRQDSPKAGCTHAEVFEAPIESDHRPVKVVVSCGE